MIRWLLKRAVLAMQDSLVAEHGGEAGIRDEGLLESALARPQQIHHYEDQPTIFRLAAAYAYGLAKNHPFVDGNKRIALTAAAVFLEINGWRLQAEEADAAVIFVELAAGTLPESELATWLEQHSTRLG
jgi:death-on-curing protein